ncbi:heavy-metal-associated domain-containing protein [Streptomyces sp. ISL-99]|uniref:heavy-metal-associated domain-containing protein n=1 Tax=Streptomyces sp. ISL-99 TaxID=2819193 RepID=UPI001BE93A12|nr:heavy metal-associated domain-containing protein [Streptomyces sp. ISL-99]MBT2525626.1 heavy-metal-associated domain-containing protein [Streptomyces sp. ISL-99]
MTEKLVLKVQGMDCAGCEQRLTAAVQRLEGVRSAAADHATGVLEVELASGSDREAVTARVSEAGYTVTDQEARS